MALLSSAHLTMVSAAALALTLGCQADGGKKGDSARGAPPEPQRTAVSPSDPNPTPAAGTDSSPRNPADPSSPWPADTFDVRIDRWSFEEPAELAKIPTCQATTPVISGDSIGPLRAGLTRAAVERRCPRLHYGWYYSDDQLWIPAANVRLGPATFLLEFDGTTPNARVARVAAIDPGARTRDGLGAGSTLAEARRILGQPTLVPAKCAIFARWPSRPGLVARIVLTDETGWECSSMRQVAERNLLARVPADSHIGYFAQVQPTR